MSDSRTRLGEMQKRLLWFILFATLLCLGAGVYLGNIIYYGLGLLGIGVLLGSLIRWFYERFRS
jgi:hypothetical protein